MGACCTKDVTSGDSMVADAIEDQKCDGQDEEEDEFIVGDCGARIRLHGASRYTSLYTQQGRKGVNQDAMTVWEEFTGEKDMIFCGVFDGHGPYGHKVSRHIRDILPSRLSATIKASQLNNSRYRDIEYSDGSEVSAKHKKKRMMLLSSWEAALVKCFREMDEELSVDASIDSFCSGATAVNVIKQGNHLIIANLGDSRAVLCTRGTKNELIPFQLTVDLKPNVASEAERIQKCKGRIFALQEEPHVARVWMPDEDCPGLAMARAFGDFCLKDHGLISTPEVSYRRLTERDEFVVLATDGIWDVLSNDEVIKIVASASKRSMAAKTLVKHAVRRWRTRYPNSKVDDCAVVCLFFKARYLSRSFSEVSRVSINPTELAEGRSELSRASIYCSEIAAIPQHPSSGKRGGYKPASSNAYSEANAGSGSARDRDRARSRDKQRRLS